MSKLKNQAQWLQSYPPHMRDDILENLQGQTVIRYPANHRTSKGKVSYPQSPLWTTLVPYVQDDDLCVTKTAPDSLVNKVMSNLEELGIPFQTTRI